jgi:hypothetical protein
VRPMRRGINALDVLSAAQVSIALERAVDQLTCPHCGNVGCRVAETLPDGKRAVRCKTCKRPMHEEKKAMNLGEMQKEVFEVARDKGWWDDCARLMQAGAYVEHPAPGLETVPDRRGRLDMKKVESLIPEKLCLIHSEITEANDELEARQTRTTFEASGKPVGFPTEIADVVIRALDLAGAMEASIERTLALIDEPHGRIGSRGHEKGPRRMTVEQELLHLHAVTSRALECYRKNEIEAHEAFEGQPGEPTNRYITGVVGELARLVMHCFRFAEKEGIDLDHEIAQKHAFNQKRSFKHGNKRC